MVFHWCRYYLESVVQKDVLQVSKVICVLDIPYPKG